MLILNEKVVWVNKDYSKLKNVKGGDWLFILTWIGKLLYGDKYDELISSYIAIGLIFEFLVFSIFCIKSKMEFHHPDHSAYLVKYLL